VIVDATWDQVRRIAADVLGVPLERLTPDSAPESVESWDSIRHLSLALALEEHFGVIFAPEEIEQMVNLGALVQALGIRAALVGMGLAFGAYAIWVGKLGAVPLKAGGSGNG